MATLITLLLVVGGSANAQTEDPNFLIVETLEDGLDTQLWLRLQDLDKVEPDEYWYPHYTRQLMDAMRRETELLFSHLGEEDLSMLQLYSADFSFLNERLARHYGIDGVYGEEFRKASYPNDQRRGIPGHGSIPTQASLGSDNNHNCVSC